MNKIIFGKIGKHEHLIKCKCGCRSASLKVRITDVWHRFECHSCHLLLYDRFSNSEESFSVLLDDHEYNMLSEEDVHLFRKLEKLSV